MNEAPYQKTTIVFPTNGDEILLGLKNAALELAGGTVLVAS